MTSTWCGRVEKWLSMELSTKRQAGGWLTVLARGKFSFLELVLIEMFRCIAGVFLSVSAIGAARNTVADSPGDLKLTNKANLRFDN